MKWSTPHFDYKGPLAGMAAFKAHCAFGFWKGSLIVPGSKEAMGQFGCITKLADLPRDELLIGYDLADLGTNTIARIALGCAAVGLLALIFEVFVVAIAAGLLGLAGGVIGAPLPLTHI